MQNEEMPVKVAGVVVLFFSVLVLSVILVTGYGKKSDRISDSNDGIDPAVMFEHEKMLFECIEKNATDEVSGLLEGDDPVPIECTLQQGMDPCWVVELDGYTPLLFAVELGKEDMVDLLLSHEADVNGLGPDGITPLMLAVKHGNASITEKLVDAGGDLSLAADDGMQALGFAVENENGEGNSYKLASILIDSGADVNALQRDEYTPLMLAAKRGDHALLKLLLDANADPNVIASDGMFAFAFLATVKNIDSKIFDAFLEHGSDVNLANPDGVTPLVAAAQNDRLPLSQWLLARGAKVNVEYYDGDDRLRETPLIRAALKSNTDMIRLFAKNGAELNCLTLDNVTPLIASAYRGDSVTNELMLDLGAKIDLKNDSGETALLYAAVYGKSENAKLLIKRGAKVNYLTNSGLTPLLAAAESGSAETVAVLREAGADQHFPGSENGILGTPLDYCRSTSDDITEINQYIDSVIEKVDNHYDD